MAYHVLEKDPVVNNFGSYKSNQSQPHLANLLNALDCSSVFI